MAVGLWGSPQVGKFDDGEQWQYRHPPLLSNPFPSLPVGMAQSQAMYPSPPLGLGHASLPMELGCAPFPAYKAGLAREHAPFPP